MNTFCPLIKDECKNDKCVMWKNEECLIVPFLEHFSSFGQMPDHLDKQEETSEETPQEIREATPEQLAEELMTFYRNQNIDDAMMYLDSLVLIPFWESKGIDKFSAPLEIRTKAIKAEQIFEKKLQKESDEAERKEIEKEEEELPNLAASCCEWAQEKDLRKVTRDDVELFLTNKKVKIMREIKNMLRRTVNIKLRTRH